MNQPFRLPGPSEVDIENNRAIIKAIKAHCLYHNEHILNKNLIPCNQGLRQEELWNSRLAPLAALTTKVSIVDRYLFTSWQKNSNGRSRSKEHVLWLIEQLATTLKNGSEIEVFALNGSDVGRSPDGYNVPFNDSELSMSLKPIFDKLEPATITLTIHLHSKSTDSHQRYIRFDNVGTIWFDNFIQLRVNRHDKLEQNLNLGWISPDAQAHLEERENALKKVAPLIWNYDESALKAPISSLVAQSPVRKRFPHPR